MSLDNKVFFVPNFSLKMFSRDYYLPPPDKKFVDELIDAGKEVYVLTWVEDKNDDFSGGILSKHNNLNIRSIGYVPKLSNNGKIYSYIKALVKIISFIYNDDGFLYIYYPGTINTLIACICLVMRRRFGLYVRGIWKQQYVSGWLSKLIISKASFIFATGYGFCEKIKNINPHVKPVVPMISIRSDNYDQVELDTFKDGIINLLFVGHIKEKKGVLDSVRAISGMIKSGKNVKLKVVGGGSESDISKLLSEINVLGLTNEVEYVGQINNKDKLNEYYKSADVFVYPSYYPEGFPRVIYEAMIHGKVILCTILPGMKGFMKNGGNCIEVMPKQPESIVQCFNEIAENKKYAVSLGAEAKRTIRDYLTSFNLGSHAQQVLQELNRGING